MDFDQTDHVIVSLIKKLAPSVSEKGILTISLDKLLFLIDYEHFKATGKQATDFRYIWYRYGPYPIVDFEPRLEKLEGYEIARVRKARVIDERPYDLFYFGENPRFTPRLGSPLSSILSNIVDIFSDADWKILLEYVYNLDIVRGLEFGQPIDFGVQMRTVDEIFLEKVANAFKEELNQPLGVEHFNAIDRALKEPTNENIETARRMLVAQHRASKYS
jgi:hypothetical protein